MFDQLSLVDFKETAQEEEGRSMHLVLISKKQVDKPKTPG